MIAFFTILVTLATWLLRARSCRLLAFAVFFGTLLQAPLGALTVHFHLNPWLVLSHFLLSIVVLTLGVVLALETRRSRANDVAAPGCRGGGLLVGLRGDRPDRQRHASRPPRARTRAARSCAGCGRSSPRSTGTCARRPSSGVSFAVLLVWLVRTAQPQVRGALVLLGLLAVQMVDRRDAVPHAAAVVARARARDRRGDRVGRRHGVRLQPLAPA